MLTDHVKNDVDSFDDANRPAPKLYRVYYFLALFDVLVVVLGLLLNHLIVETFNKSVDSHDVWNARLNAILELGNRCVDVNMPVNEVFESGDADKEEGKFKAALIGFDEHMRKVKSDLEMSNMPDETRNRLTTELTRIESSVNLMKSEGAIVFPSFRNKETEKAAAHMVIADRAQHELFETLTRLRGAVNAIQADLLGNEREVGTFLSRFEYLLALFVAIMIAAALIYGHKIRNQIESNHHDREIHIVRIQEARESLKEAHAGLEIKVRERTEDLEAANRTLQSEIQERIRADARLQDYARKLERSNRELEDFARVASHDLQEPLRKVQAFGDRLLAKCGNQIDDEGRRYVERMRNATERMQILINDLLTFSRVTTKSQPFARVDLEKICREVLEDLEVRIQQKGAEVEVGELPTLDADPTQMRQLLQNLIGNALKFHPPHVAPRVRVFARRTVRPTPAAEVVGAEPYQIHVEDNGIGFDEKYLDRIFTVFQRLHGRNDYEGSGVGLAVCRKIVERHGGAITAKSAPGAGATFIITLPPMQCRETET